MSTRTLHDFSETRDPRWWGPEGEVAYTVIIDDPTLDPASLFGVRLNVGKPASPSTYAVFPAVFFKQPIPELIVSPVSELPIGTTVSVSAVTVDILDDVDHPLFALPAADEPPDELVRDGTPRLRIVKSYDASPSHRAGPPAVPPAAPAAAAVGRSWTARLQDLPPMFMRGQARDARCVRVRIVVAMTLLDASGVHKSVKAEVLSPPMRFYAQARSKPQPKGGAGAGGSPLSRLALSSASTSAGTVSRCGPYVDLASVGSAAEPAVGTVRPRVDDAGLDACPQAHEDAAAVRPVAGGCARPPVEGPPDAAGSADGPRVGLEPSRKRRRLALPESRVAAAVDETIRLSPLANRVPPRVVTAYARPVHSTATTADPNVRVLATHDVDVVSDRACDASYLTLCPADPGGLYPSRTVVVTPLWPQPAALGGGPLGAASPGSDVDLRPAASLGLAGAPSHPFSDGPASVLPDFFFGNTTADAIPTLPPHHFDDCLG